MFFGVRRFGVYFRQIPVNGAHEGDCILDKLQNSLIEFLTEMITQDNT